MSVSVIVITKNEEAVIGRCLASVSWADEIVVVDSGSADRTVELSRAAGAKVTVTADWPGFGPQKNRALDLATGDWVLSLDADEWVSPALAAEIRGALASPGGAVAFHMPRFSSFCGRFMRHSGWWPDRVARLFRRGSARFSNDIVHERLVIEGLEGALHEPLLHESFTDLEHVLEKMDRYSTASAQMLYARGKRASLGTAVFRGLWAFVRTYLLRAGFLDGSQGFMLAVSNAEGTYYRYAKLRLLARAGGRVPEQNRMPVSQIVNVVEPTLANEAGHCSTVVHGLCAAGAGLPFRLWVGRGARLPTLERLGLDIRPRFSRRLRKLQALFVYRKLLREPGAIIVPTAGRFDLQALDLVAPRQIPPDKVFLYFHRLRLTPAKEAVLRRLACRQPNVTMLGTTESIEAKLRDLGFPNTGVVLPFPVPAAIDDAVGQTFRHVLVAGAARADKGFGQVVQFVEHLQRSGSAIPVTIQVSGDHYDRYDEPTRKALDTLRALRYRHLTLLPETLVSDAYAGMFLGAICLQPYDREEYADKISGITLDALTAGAPVVPIANTWMARTIERFEAGVTVADTSPAALDRAVHLVIDGYERYSDNARAAGAMLRSQQTWMPIMDRLRRNGETTT